MLVGAGIGLLIRIRQFLVGRSLWLDEAMVAESIGERDAVQLVTSPLLNNQRAPAGFLLANKLMTASFGETDYALRIASLLAGSLAVILAVALARRTLTTTVGQLTLVSAVSFSPVLIYYSVELKQYTFDVAATLAVLVASTYWDEGRGWRILAAVGALCMWFSHVAVFVMGVVWFVHVWEARPRVIASRAVVNLTISWGVLAVPLAAQVLATNDSTSGDVLARFWQDAYAPVPTSLGDLRWYGDSALGVVHLGFSHGGIAGRQQPAAWWSNWNYVLLTVVVASAVVLAFRRRQTLTVPGLVLAVAIAASALELYPFAGRLILYVLPMVFLVVAAAIDDLALESKRLHFAAVIASVVVLAPTVVAAVSVGFEPDNSKDMESALEFVNSRFEEGDVIALHNGSRAAFDFYADEAGLDQVPLMRVGNDFDPDTVLLEVNDQRVSRLWVIVTHRAAESRVLMDGLREEAKALVRRNSAGTRVALFTFESD